MRKWIVLVVISLALAPLAAAAGDEKLSEVEQLRVEKAQLLATLAKMSGDRSGWRTSFSQCIDELGKVEAGQATQQANTFSDALMAEVEKNHKGYTLNAKGELVEKEKKD